MDAWNCLPLNYALLEGDSARTSARHAIALPTVSGFFYFSLIGLLLLGAVNFQSNIGFLLAFALLTIGFVGLVFVGVNFHGVNLATDGDIYCESGKDPVVRIQLQSKSEHQQIQIASDIDATTCDVSSNLTKRCMLEIRRLVTSRRISSMHRFVCQHIREECIHCQSLRSVVCFRLGG